MRTGRSAHRAIAEPREVRGRPRPHSDLGARFDADREVRAPRNRPTPGGARTSPSAFRSRREVRCGPGGPRTAQPPNPGRCADVPVRIPGPAQGSMRTGRSAHRAIAQPREVRGRPRPHSGSGARFDADREVRAPRSRPTPEVRGRPRPHSDPAQGSMRTGRSAHRAVAELREVRGRPPSAFRVRSKVRCGPGGPRTAQSPNPGRCADVPVRIPGPARGSMRTGRSAHRAIAEPREVRGRPRPHPGRWPRARRVAADPESPP